MQTHVRPEVMDDKQVFFLGPEVMDDSQSSSVE